MLFYCFTVVISGILDREVPDTTDGDTERRDPPRFLSFLLYGTSLMLRFRKARLFAESDDSRDSIGPFPRCDF